MKDATRSHTLDRLLNLRTQLSHEIPQKHESTLLLSTWNIRDLGGSRLNPSPRLDESFHYIAEILNAFDLIAIQEVNRNTADFETIMTLLGSHYTYLLTDTTEGRGGNDERIAFVYDTRKVEFTKLVGEVVLPQRGNTKGQPRQFARTPYLASFQAGWFKFYLCGVHAYYGADKGPKLEERVKELDQLAGFFKKRQEKEPGDYFLLGDFNIVNMQHKTMKALLKHGFQLPGGLTTEHIAQAGSNLNQDKWYDQIVVRPSDQRLGVGRSGVFNFRKAVFTDAEVKRYKPMIPEHLVRGDGPESLAKAYKKWLTWQMSDHLPLWVELKVDFTDDYLRSLMPGETILAMEPK